MTTGVIILLIQTLTILFYVMYGMLFARIILSWFTMGRSNRLMDLLYMLTEPILAPIRSLLQRSPLGGPGMIIDFSPIIAFILLRLVFNLVIAFLAGLV